ncbi:CHASE domain-containing protein [Roseateles sp.]|uniref:CHASE domain-containing protein n=1 Tax=Roseateles sp. TaxID=1971397 RepID=UPI0039ECDEE4
MSVWVHSSNRRQLEERLFKQSADVAAIVRQRFGLYEYGLRGARGAVVAAGGAAVTRAMFEAYMASRETAREFPGARGFGFIRRVPRQAETEFLSRARAEGPADFTLRTLGNSGNELFVIQYLYPLEVNRAAMGLDIASEPSRRAAALESARDGLPHLTRPLTLVQADGMPRRGFLALLPVYAPRASLHSAEAREAATVGWTFAPLLVDDVLADLGPLLNELRITLTDSGEASPFYESGAAADDAPISGVANHEISLFGRRWQMKASARPGLLEGAHLLSPRWVGSAAALAWGLLTLLLWTWLRTRKAWSAGAAAGMPAASDTRVATFLGSRLARKAALAFLVFLGLFAWLDYEQQWGHQATNAQQVLKALVNERVERIKVTQTARRKTVLFLAETPPVRELARSAALGPDGKAGLSASRWALQLQQIFIAQMKSSPEVTQARLIGVADGGRELVRVDRRDGDLAIAPPTALRAEGDGPDMRQTINIPAGEVLVSQLELDRELGHLAVPHRPTVRYSTPVHTAKGDVFGIVTLTVDVAPRMAESAALVPPRTTLYLLNADDDFLLHPDTTKTFGAERGQPYRWGDEFHLADLPRGMDPRQLQAWRGSDDAMLVEARATVDPNAGSNTGRLTYVAAQPVLPLTTAAYLTTAAHLLMPFIAGLAGATLLYFYWVGMQRQLQARGERLRLASIVDHSRDAIISLDESGRVLSWNRGAELLFGIESGVAAGNSLVSLVSDPTRPLVLAGGTDTAAEQEHWCRTSDGRAILLSMSVSSLDGPDTGVKAGTLSVILRDITAEWHARQAQAQLNESLEAQVRERTAALAQERERLQNILRGTDAGTWEWNVQTGEIRLNERWAGIIGYTLDELAPMDMPAWHARMHDDDCRKSQLELERHFSGETELYAFESRMRHKDGRWVWVQDRGRVTTRTPDGRPEWMFGTHKDITAAKTAQLELTRLATLLRSVLDAATEFAIIATDPDGLISIFNVGAERLLGYASAQMVGHEKPTLLHLPAELDARAAELTAQYGHPVDGFRVLTQQAELQGAEQREWTYVRCDGSRLSVLLVVTPMRSADDRIVGYLGIAEDVSARKRAEAELRQAKADADAANAAKSEFLANMSHEIRTPMNAVIGIAHLLESTPLDAEQRQLLSKLHIAGRSLLGIINDVLDLSKIEAGEMRVELAPLSPMRLLDELEQVFAPQAHAKGITLRIEGAESLPPLIESDEMRLRQVLVNLLSNAIKFTATGGVVLRVASEVDADGVEWLRWTVVDSGIGIAPEALARLFDPFVQADASTTRRFGGTGLGLAIVSNLGQLLGGQVGASSVPGQGSEFWLRTPLISVAPDEAWPADADAVIEVMVVDDVPDDLHILGQLCRALGWRTTELGSGEALLEHIQARLSAGRSMPDALLVDWQMPGMDGVMALESIARQVGVERLPAMLVVSAHERSRIEAQDNDGLVDSVLSKPVTSSELFNAVNHSVSRHTGSTERVVCSTRIGAVDAQWLQGLRVLLVDDSEINLEVGKRLLEREGARVHTAQDGQQAVDVLRADAQQFDAVLMDVQMPVLDGYAATARIRGELGLTILPVLALTAGALDEERRRAEAAGMTDFLTKPLDPAALVRALRRAIEHARGKPLPLAPPSPPPDVQAPVPDWPHIQGIDTAAVVQRLNGNRELFLRMLQRLLRDFPADKLASSWPDALQTQRDGLAAQMHKLRGASGTLGANDVYELSGSAEDLLRTSGSDASLPAVMESLCQALQRLALACEPHLRPSDRGTVPTGHMPIPSKLDPADIEVLLDSLRQQDLAAVETIRRLAPALSAHWGEETVARLQEAVSELDFANALDIARQACTDANQ